MKEDSKLKIVWIESELINWNPEPRLSCDVVVPGYQRC